MVSAKSILYNKIVQLIDERADEIESLEARVEVLESEAEPKVVEEPK